MADETNGDAPAQEGATPEQQVQAATTIIGKSLAWSHNPRSELSPYDQQKQNEQAWQVMVHYAQRGAQAAMVAAGPDLVESTPNRAGRRSKPKSPRSKVPPKLEAVPAAEG